MTGSDVVTDPRTCPGCSSTMPVEEFEGREECPWCHHNDTVDDREVNDIDRGVPVLLRFQSHFNREATQTVVGRVAGTKPTENEFAELAVRGEDGGLYKFIWDGGVERYDQEDRTWVAYGGAARLYTLSKIDPASGPDADGWSEEEKSSYRQEDEFLEGGMQ